MNTTDTSAGCFSRKAKKGVGVVLATTALTLFLGAVNVHASIFEQEYVEKVGRSDGARNAMEMIGLEEEYNNVLEEYDEYLENKNSETAETEESEENEVLENDTENAVETLEEESSEKSVDEISPMLDYATALSYANSLYSNTDLNSPSGISREDFIAYCKGMPSRHDPNGFYKRNCEYIWNVCQEVGFNEFAFLGVSSWEGGWAAHGVSYNYYGTLGMRYGSEHEGISGWVNFMKNNYISQSGKYYHGPTLKNIGPTYCSQQWTYDVLARVQDSALRV
ncbi:MAG: hypothetical protein IKF52_01555 [Clostridia bacterium]|nr:hypothetical protein [Clostridia bacterium]